LTDTVTLLVRRAILERETLVSFLFRLAIANHYEPPNLLIRHCLMKNRVSEISGKRISLTQDPAIFARLSKLTGTPPTRLFDATAHKFAQLITPPDVQTGQVAFSEKQAFPLLGSGIADKQLRSEYAVQFCPKCLEDEAHFPLIWMPIAISSCIQHSCILAITCGFCSKGIGVFDIVQRKCKRCGHDLRNTPTISIKDDEWGLLTQRTLRVWLSFAEQHTGHDTIQLPNQPVRVMYRVLDGIRQVLQSDPPMACIHTIPGHEGDSLLRNRMTRRSLTPTESYILYATAMKALSNWPSGFHDFLDAFGDHSDKASTSIIKQRFGLLHSNWLQGRWAHPHFHFVQKSYDQYLLEEPIAANSLVQLDRYRHKRKSHKSYRYISMSDAARTLKISTDAVRKLIAAGQLGNVPPKDFSGKSGSIFLLRDDVAILSGKWNSAVSLKKALDILGLNRRVALDLAHAGKIKILRGPTFDGYRAWRLDKKSVEAYLSKILASVGSDPSPGEMVDLTGAVHITANVGLKAVALLCRVSQGHLTPYRTNRKGFARLKDLGFLRTDIFRLCHKIVKENGWVKRKEIISLLQINARTLDNLIRSGSLAPSAVCNNIVYFDLTAAKERSLFDVRVMDVS